MKIEFKAKLIQHISQHQSDRGLTLIELLAVISIVGVLAALGLPNFISQSARTKQTEAKQNISLINQLQTTYRSENNSFATNFDVLATGTLRGASSTTSTSNYTYTLVGSTSPQDNSSVIAVTNDTAARSYAGGTNRYIVNNVAIISSIICENKYLEPTTHTTPVYTTTTAPDCTSSLYNSLGK